MKTQHELNIFKATSIELLESLYYKSKAYLTTKNRLLADTSLFVKGIRPFRKTAATKGH